MTFVTKVTLSAVFGVLLALGTLAVTTHHTTTLADGGPPPQCQPCKNYGSGWCCPR
jgi:hypothetical protein